MVDARRSKRVGDSGHLVDIGNEVVLTSRVEVYEVEGKQTNGAMREGISPITLHRCFNPRSPAGTDTQRLGLCRAY